MKTAKVLLILFTVSFSLQAKELYTAKEIFNSLLEITGVSPLSPLAKRLEGLYLPALPIEGNIKNFTADALMSLYKISFPLCLSALETDQSRAAADRWLYRGHPIEKDFSKWSEAEVTAYISDMALNFFFRKATQEEVASLRKSAEKIKKIEENEKTKLASFCAAFATSSATLVRE